MPGLHLALLCSSGLTCFDWLRKFRRNWYILDFEEKTKKFKNFVIFAVENINEDATDECVSIFLSQLESSFVRQRS